MIYELHIGSQGGYWSVVYEKIGQFDLRALETKLQKQKVMRIVYFALDFLLIIQ